MTTPGQASGDQRTWSVIAHASALIQFIGIPSVVGPLVVFLIKREDLVVAPHARAALNFQLSLLIYFVVGVIAAFAAAITLVGLVMTAMIVILLFVLLVLEILFAILGTLAASKGELYPYPLSLDLITS